ncbi:DUF881 domain-containing protein [Peterkaempfera bronchialis]|uniref:DUF881 domain-containing protein n=1 Tax=Peterkaempfera bronchialis TaxID=2126346 RepID=UPI003C30E391
MSQDESEPGRGDAADGTPPEQPGAFGPPEQGDRREQPSAPEQPPAAGGPEAGTTGPEESEQPGQPESDGPDGDADRPDTGGAPPDGRRRLLAAAWPPRVSRAQLVVAVLLFALGLGLAIQVSSTNDQSQLRGARQEDLVRILDELDGRQQRLQQEKHQLEQSLAQLETSSNQAKEAQAQTRRKEAELGVLAGTVTATGPGITLTIRDPGGGVKADMLLDTLQELRAAGAEAIQINNVRVVADTYFTDPSSGGVQIDGKSVSQPYVFTVIGNPQDLQPALNIPGGVVRTLEKQQATASIAEEEKLTVDALIQPKTPEYARPAQP